MSGCCMENVLVRYCRTGGRENGRSSDGGGVWKTAMFVERTCTGDGGSGFVGRVRVCVCVMAGSSPTGRATRRGTLRGSTSRRRAPRRGDTLVSRPLAARAWRRSGWRGWERRGGGGGGPTRSDGRSVGRPDCRGGTRTRSSSPRQSHRTPRRARRGP